MKKSKPPKAVSPHHNFSYYPDSIAPDGLIIFLDMQQFEVGMSMFVPAIKLQTARKQIKKLTKEKGWEVSFADRIEDGKLGVRFWRLL
jgi:hypothetical protein